MTKKLLLLTLLLLCLSISVLGQSSTNTATRVRNGTADPSTCTTTGSNIFYRTDTGELKVCTAANTWTAVGGGANPAGSGSEIQYRVDGTTFGAVTGSSGASGVVSFSVADSGNTTVIDLLKITHVGTDTPDVGFGTGFLHRGADSDNNLDDMMRVAAVWSDATSTSEDSAFVVQLRAAGAALAEKFRGTSTGIWQSTGLQASNLTSTRIPIIGASGLLGDDADLTFSGSTTTATNLAVTTTLTVAGAAVTNNIVQNSQSAAYTTVLADAGKHILHPTADNNARTFTIDSNANVAYPVGTCITFVNQINTVTIAITSDTLVLAGAGTTGSRTLAANGIATAIKISATVWIISGTGLT